MYGCGAGREGVQPCTDSQGYTRALCRVVLGTISEGARLEAQKRGSTYQYVGLVLLYHSPHLLRAICVAGMDDCVLVLDVFDDTAAESLCSFRCVIDCDELVGAEGCHLG